MLDRHYVFEFEFILEIKYVTEQNIVLQFFNYVL